MKLNDKWGYVDKNGKEIIPIQYDDADTFLNGKARVKKDGAYITIDNPLKKATSTPQAVSLKTETKSNESTVKAATPPLAMKGVVDPAVVGTWKFYNATWRLTTYYIFKADGTYDYYADVISPTNPLSSRGCHWRIDGNFLESLCEETRTRMPFLKRNDPATGKPALFIDFNGSSRMYVTMEDKAPWK